MITYAYIKHINTVTQNVGHLYEHLFIESFYAYVVEKLHIDPSVIGYIGGETFENVMFIEAWFYNDKIAKLFQRFIKKERLDFKLLSLSVSQVCAEDRVEWSILNKAELETQIKKVSGDTWNLVENLDVFEYKDTLTKQILPIEIIHKASDYKAILITAYMTVSDLSLKERALFLRLSVIVQELIESEIRALGFYEHNSHSPQELGEYLVSKIGAVRPRLGISNKELENIIEKHLRTFDWSNNKQYIKSHFNEYSKQQFWKADPRDQFKHVNVIAGNKTVKSLATKENILGIFHKIEVRVETVSFQDIQNIK